MTDRFILIGCVAAKATEARPARDLYTSNLFAARRAYAEASGHAWGIVSAHALGIIDPNRVIEPYDRTMEQKRHAELRQWSLDAGHSAYQVFGEAILGSTVEVHAGARYVAALRDALVRRFDVTLDVPLVGLAIGQQLAWYKARRASL